MVKVSVKNNKYSETIKIIVVAILIIIVILKAGILGSERNQQGSNSSGESLLYKEEHKLTYEEWKKVAQIYANQYLNCNKDLTWDFSKVYISENCGIRYRNQYVRFREGLENRANLNWEQTRQLLKYWDELSDKTIELVKKRMDENDRKMHPNSYK